MRWTICTCDRYGVEMTVEYANMPDFLRDTDVLRGFTEAVELLIYLLCRPNVWL